MRAFKVMGALKGLMHQSNKVCSASLALNHPVRKSIIRDVSCHRFGVNVAGRFPFLGGEGIRNTRRQGGGCGEVNGD